MSVDDRVRLVVTSVNGDIFKWMVKRSFQLENMREKIPGNYLVLLGDGTWWNDDEPAGFVQTRYLRDRRTITAELKRALLVNIKFEDKKLEPRKVILPFGSTAMNLLPIVRGMLTVREVDAVFLFCKNQVVSGTTLLDSFAVDGELTITATREVAFG